MWKQTQKETAVSGIEVTLNELVELRRNLTQLIKGNNKWLKQTGQLQTRIRGRGLEFDATREYQAGDDLRNMAWRVTARSLKPHIKVYHEERERPVWLAVDLSPSLYFGTRRMFKSVCAIKKAAAIGWAHLQKRERIGAMIAAEQKPMIFKPQASERNFLAILNSLAQSSAAHPEYNEKNYLRNLLINLQQQARSGSLIFILSDFFDFDDECQKLILHIAQRAQVALIFVYDPFEAEPPPPYQYLLTNGREKVAFNMDNAQSRFHYQQQFQMKQDDLLAFTRKYNIALQVVRTDQE
jgi:uncharacterized protein (DUF58 family)